MLRLIFIICVSKESIEAYKNAEKWKDFGTITNIPEPFETKKEKIGGVYYILYEESQTAIVTSENEEYPYWSSSPTSLTIPSSVFFYKKNYNVISIGE